MTEDFKPIAREARIVWGLSGVALLTVLGLLMTASAAYVSTTAVVVVLVITGALDVWWWWISGRRWKAWGYAERKNDLVLRRGVLVRRLTIIPYGRMQFIDTKQGPLDRLLGVSTVVLNTAAAASDARIPMVKDAEAERLREQLTHLGETHAAGL